MASSDRRKQTTSQAQSSVPGSVPPPSTEQVAQQTPGGGDVLKVLTEFESGLDALRRLYAERQALQTRLKEREDELLERTQQLDEKSDELSELRARFDEQVRELDQSRAEIDQREKELGTRSEQLEHAMRAHAAAQRQSEEATAAALEEINAQRTNLKREHEKLAERTRETEKRSKDLGEQAKRLEQAEGELASQRAEAERERAGLDELARSLAQRGGELDAREKAIEAQQAAIQKQLATREQRIGELQGAIAEREQAIEATREQIASKERELAGVREECTRVLARCGVLEGELRIAKEAGDAAAAQLGEDRERNQRLVSDLEQRVGEQQSLARELAERVEQQEQAFAQQRDGLRAQLAQHTGKLEELERALAGETEARQKAEAACAAIGSEWQARHEREVRESASRVREELHAQFEAAKEQQRAQFAEERRQSERRSSERMSQAIAEASSAATTALEKRLREEMVEEVAREVEAARAAALAEGQQRLASEQRRWEQLAQERAQLVAREASERAAEQARAEATSSTSQELTQKLTKHFEAQHAQNLAAQLAMAASAASATLDRELREQEAALREQARQAIEQEQARFERQMNERVSEAQREAQATFERQIHALDVQRATLQARLEASETSREQESARAASQGDELTQGLREELSRERALREKLALELASMAEAYQAYWGEHGLGLPTSIASIAPGVSDEETFGRLRQAIKEDAEARQEGKEQLETTTHQLADAMSRVVALETRLRAHSEDGRSVAGSWRTPESMEKHRQRLAFARSLMREQTHKIRRGSEALRRRFEQTERVLSQRAELAQARERVIDAERRVQSAAAKSKVAVVMLCVTTSIAILGGLSYGLARELAPATFVASSIIAADGRGRDLNTAELKEWKTYHEKILQDPRFHQMAGERFRRVGLEGFSSASAVAKLAEEQIDVQERVAGEMMFALSGQGSTRTERVLDTFTAAVVSHANAAQTARVDGSVTAVKQQAKSGSDPIDKTRLYWALGMLGAGVLVLGVVALGLWRKLAGAKTQFERDTQLAAVLDQARWGDVEMPDLKDIEKRTTKPSDAKASEGTSADAKQSEDAQRKAA